MIRRLLDGEEVSHDGLVTSTGPGCGTCRRSGPPARRSRGVGGVGSTRGGLGGRSRHHQPAVEVLRDARAAYRDAGGAGPLSLQVHLSWAPTRDEAEAIALDQWRTNVFTEPVNWDTETPRRST